VPNGPEKVSVNGHMSFKILARDLRKVLQGES
jgi:hypothetical protein